MSDFCLLCNVYLTNETLQSHVYFKHSKVMTTKMYYDKFLKKKDEGVCICGNETKFISITIGYNKICNINCKISKSGNNNPNFGNTIIHTKEFKEKQRINAINNGLGKVYTTKGMKLNITEERRKALRKHINNVNNKGFENKGGRCKFYQINGVLIQGRYELYYYLNNSGLKKSNKLKTPYGWYQPDFVDKIGNLIEIKSNYTFSILKTSKQLRKIKWLNKHGYKVKIVVLNQTLVDNYLSNININQYRHQISSY